MQIILNGDEINVSPENKITYEALVGLAGHHGSSEMIVKFDRLDGSRGSLKPGESVGITSGMNFRVAHAGGA